MELVPAQDRMNPLTFSIYPAPWSGLVSSIPSALSPGQDRAYSALISSPGQAQPSLGQPQGSKRPSSTQLRAEPSLKPQVCSGLSPLGPVESSGDSRSRGWELLRVSRAIVVDSPSRVPAGALAPHLGSY